MKKILFTTTFLMLITSGHAQVAIGKDHLSSNSVSLEFGDYVPGNGRGFILPYVKNPAATMQDAIDGTLVFNAETSHFMVKSNLPNVWKPLPLGIWLGDKPTSTSLQDPWIEKETAKVSIGTPSNTPGILVLEDHDKAMILPKVPFPHLNVENPEPGTIVYDTATKRLAVFDGTLWLFFD